MPNDLWCNDSLLSRLVLPYVRSFCSTGALFQSNSRWSMQLAETGGAARVVWIDMASEMTRFPAFKFVPDEIKARLAAIRERADFVSEVRSLICPWTNPAEKLRPNCGALHETRFRYITDDDSRLVFHTVGARGAWGDIDVVELSCSSTPCEDFAGTIVRRRVENNIAEAVTSIADSVSYENDLQEKLLQMLDMHAYTRFSNATFKFVPIHGAVFAVMAFFRLPNRLGSVNRNSVYYFSMSDGRVLLQTLLPSASSEDATVILSRPGKLWITGEHGVTFYGRVPGCKHVRLAYHSERAAEAFFMISKGEVHAAIHFMQYSARCDLDTAPMTNYRTLLHHAVACDQPVAVTELLRHGATPCLEDACKMTPLELACFMYHHECVEILTKTQDPADDAIWKRVWTDAWRRVCDPETFKNCLQEYPEKESAFLETMIPRTVAALWASVPIMSDDDERSCIMRGLRSRTILTSKKALEVLLQHRPSITPRFALEGGFKCMLGGSGNKIQEEAMLDAMRMAVLRFGLDINATSGVTMENHVVWAVRMGSLETVRVLIKELGADVKSRSNRGDSLLKIAMSRASRAPDHDTHGGEILHFLTHEVEHVLEMVVARMNASSWQAQLDFPLGLVKPTTPTGF